MKIALVFVVLLVGLLVFVFTAALSPMQKNMTDAANASATEVLGSNYTANFGYMPAILGMWWIIPILLVGCLICYGLYKVIKG